MIEDPREQVHDLWEWTECLYESERDLLRRLEDQLDREELPSEEDLDRLALAHWCVIGCHLGSVRRTERRTDG